MVELLELAEDLWVVVGMLATAPLLPLLHLALIRAPWRRVAALRWAFGLYGLACAGLLATVGAVEPRPALIAGSLWLTLCLGYLQFVSMVTRSISLRLLVELDRHPGATRDELFRDYADGRGFDWLLDKRLDGLGRAGLIQRDSAGLVATGRGLVLGRFFSLAKRWLALRETG